LTSSPPWRGENFSRDLTVALLVRGSVTRRPQQVSPRCHRAQRGGPGLVLARHKEIYAALPAK